MIPKPKPEASAFERKMISIRLPTRLLDRVDEAAAKEIRTLTSMIEWILAQWVEQYEQAN